MEPPRFRAADRRHHALVSRTGIRLATMAGALLMAAVPGRGATLETGSGEVLSSAAIPLTSPELPPASVTFDFGFTTDEIPSPGTFADSFTISLENSRGQRVYIVTTDAGGSLWAPTVPGSFPIASTDLRYSTIPFDPSIDARVLTFSYRVEVPLPSSWVPDSFQVRLDLFDNQNSTASAGYVTGAAIVPEPHVLLLITVGLMTPLWRRRR